MQFPPDPARFWAAKRIDRAAVQDREFARLLADAKRMADENKSRIEGASR